MKRRILIVSILGGIAVLALAGLFGAGRMKETRRGASEAEAATVGPGTAYADCANAAMVIVPEGALDAAKAYARRWVDDGKLLYIQDAAWSKEALGEALSIPLAQSSAYSPMPHIATAIFQAGGRYVFSYIYVQAGPAVAGNSDSAPFAATPEQIEALQALLPLEEGLESARTLWTEASLAPSLLDGAEGRPAQADALYADLVKMYDPVGVHLGDGLALQYVYERGQGLVNGRQMELFDVVTRFKVLPRPGNALQTYQGRLRCDLEGQQLLDFAILPPDAGEGAVLQLGGGKLPGGAWWNYTPDGQAVTTNGAPSWGYVDYCASPRALRHGDAWELQPGIRVAAGEAGQRGAFSRLTIPALGIFGQGGAYTLEVGEWF